MFTDTYPFRGPDDPFLPAELVHLAALLSIVVIPSTNTGGPVAELPPGVTFEPDLAHWAGTRRVRAVSLVIAFLSPDGYAELWRRRWSGLRPRSVATVMVRLSRALTVERWVRRRMRSTSPHDGLVAYSWWGSSAGYGVARALRRTRIPLVVRLHGFDLYAEQDRLGFIPFQRDLLSKCALAVSVSKAGAEYLRERYPDLAGRIGVGYLGIDGQAERSAPSTDGILRVVSCSTYTEVKRVPLIVESLAVLSEREPAIDFRWTHIGAGPEEARVRERVMSHPRLSGRCEFISFVDPAGVKEWFADNPIDVFLNVSSSEGLPVALMEAASFGVPLVATAVGGNPEIVDDANGTLLPPNPSPGEVAQALLDFIVLDARRRGAMREASRGTWERKFSAARNYREFALQLVAESRVVA